MFDAEKFMEGDERELEQIMTELTPRLMKYCTSILLNVMDAEDAVQTTFIRAFKKRQTLRDPYKLIPFLYRIAYSSSINILRKRRFFQTEAREITGNPEEFLSDQMLSALESLSKLDRALVYGRAVEEYSYSELARMYNKSEVSLRKRYERACRKMTLHYNSNVHKEEMA